MPPLSIPDLHQMPVPSREEIAERVALQELFNALSWGASLFLGNCRRLNNVFDGTPYNRYCLPTPSVTLETLNSKFDTTSQTIISTLGEKIEYVQNAVTQKIGRQISRSRDEILSHLPDDDSPKAIRKAMRERAHYLIKLHPDKSIRNICQIVYEEYKGIPDAYTSAEVLRKALGMSGH